MVQKRIDRRTARGELSKHKILTSAKKLFIQHGFKETTIAMISNDAEIGYGTAYNHFPKGKDDIFLIIIEEIMADFDIVASNRYTVNSKEEAFDFIKKNVENLIDLVIKHQKLLIVIHEAIRLSDLVRKKWEEIRERLIERIAFNVEQAIAKDLARNDNFDKHIVASVLFYVTESYMWKIALNKTTKPHEAIVQNITEIYANGLYK